MLSRVRTKSRKILKNKIVLVNSHSPYFPIYLNLSSYKIYLNPISAQISLGVAYIAASLEESGFEVKIVDLNFINQAQYDVNKVKKTILKLEPDLVGLSSYTSTIPDTYKLASSIKEEKKHLPIVVGGAHVSALPKRTLEECAAIDAVIVGEGEYVFQQYLKILFSNKRYNELANLKGVIFRHNNKIFGDPTPVYVEDLDSLQFPARHLFNIDVYKKYSSYIKAKKHPVASIITSRGCPHKCIFCSRINSGNCYRARSPQNIVLEIEHLKEYGFNEIQIVDDNFTLDQHRIIELCRLIKNRKINMSFCLSNGIRVDSINEKMLSAMYDIGFYSIHFGVESGDNKILKYNRKGITVEQIKKGIRIAKKIGYNVELFTIIGLPGSSIESEKKTLKLVEESEADSAMASICTPYPGSTLWDMVKDRMHNIGWDRYKETDISNPIYLPNGMTKKQLQFIVKKVKESKKFFLSAGYYQGAEG